MLFACVHWRKKSHQITSTAWNIRNVNVYWRLKFYNSSYGCCIKLPCLPLISIITGSANWEAKVKPIFIMVIIFMWPPLQSRVWRMSCLRVRYCFVCVVMSWYLRMRRTSVLGTHFCSVLLFFKINYGLGLALRFGLSVDPVLYRLATQRLSLKTQPKIEFLRLFGGRRKELV